MECSDAELISAVLNGNKSRFADLYDRYAPLVRALCYDATGDYAHSQDLTQEVFLKAYCKLDGLSQSDRFAGWLVTIARNLCRDWIRQQKRDRHEYVERAPEVESGGNADGMDQHVSDLMDAIRKLPERERIGLHSFYLQSESIETIRATLGLSPAGVYRLLDRARRRLAGYLHAEQESRP